MKSVLGFLMLFSLFTARAQLNLQTVEGLPTREVYDLHVDKKGYLWIAHDLGISRYDGLTYLHFKTSGQASLSMTDIIEDNQGRIWCHNFSGQIFYIETGKMIHLKAYEANNETQFPRIAICGNQLLATSDHGLFVCSTENLECTYLPVQGKDRGLSSLATIGKKAILFDNINWYLYTEGSMPKKLAVENAISFASDNLVSLQPATVGSTLFVTANPAGIVKMISLEEDSLKLIANLDINDFVNGVTIDDKTWIHSRNESKTLDGKWIIEGQSLTDVVKDKEGNTWFSSLKKGLMVSQKKPLWELKKPPLDQEDFIRCLNVADGYFFAGTNKGNLYVFDSTLTKIVWEKRLFDGYGSIEFIRFFKNHIFVVGSSVNTYVVNPVEKKVEDLLPLSSVKDVDFDDNSLYLATASGVSIMPLSDSLDFTAWLQEKQKKFPSFKVSNNQFQPNLFLPGRTHAIRYDVATNSLFVAFKNGLHEVNESGLHVVSINARPVFASTMWHRLPRLFIGTYGDGLWIKTKNKARHFSPAGIFSSNTILRTKATASHLWLFQNEAMQVLDIVTENLVTDIDLPRINGANVFDVAEWQGYGYLTTADGVYKIPMNKTMREPAPGGFLDAVIVNNKDTVFGGEANLPFNYNDLQFIFSTPVFFDPGSIYFRYRVSGVDDEWRITKPRERMLRYTSLAPGRYTFEAYAISNNGLSQKHKIAFDIVIQRPWWKEAWFYTMVFLTGVGLIYFLAQYRFKQLLLVERVRRTISSDLHDDIGATLSSINIYTELAKKAKNKGTYLNAIQQHSQEVTDKLDDLIWSINPRNDSFEKLVSRMHSYALPVLQAKNIVCNFYFDEALLKEKLSVQVKQNLYLLFKELINNVVKHSGAKNCSIDFACHKNLIVLSVKDDGIGYDTLKQEEIRNGIVNMKERAEKMRGYLNIESTPQNGTHVTAYIPLPHKYASYFKKWIR